MGEIRESDDMQQQCCICKEKWKDEYTARQDDNVWTNVLGEIFHNCDASINGF